MIPGLGRSEVVIIYPEFMGSIPPFPRNCLNCTYLSVPGPSLEVLVQFALNTSELDQQTFTALVDLYSRDSQSIFNM